LLNFFSILQRGVEEKEKTVATAAIPSISNKLLEEKEGEGGVGGVRQCKEEKRKERKNRLRVVNPSPITTRLCEGESRSACKVEKKKKKRGEPPNHQRFISFLS